MRVVLGINMPSSSIESNPPAPGSLPLDVLACEPGDQLPASALGDFDGILIVTTNAGERIDTAFRRRMDVVVEFHAPEPLERWAIWQLHLPEAHGISASELEQMSSRCAITGGQIRNAVLHAAVLAVGRGGRIDHQDLSAAIRREYRKAGQVCPLAEPARG